jgi:pimeloyl-ACP methyl ester carboxylesterase
MPFRRIDANGIWLHVQDEGNGGEPVLLLHGFPDSHRVWRHQVPALTAAGFRIVVPDLRGFGASDKPVEVAAYAVPCVVQDMIAVLDELDLPRAHVVCHDYGATVGWVLAARHPQRVHKLVALSVGHPTAFHEAGFDQREKAWYMLLFQFEGVAEELLQRDDWAFLRDWSRHHPEAQRWVADLSRPGALTAALNWYRANVAPKHWLARPPKLPPVTAPTLAMWSSGDRYLTETQIVRSREFVEGPWRYERIEGASHWLQLDQPEQVNRLMLQWLRA